MNIKNLVLFILYVWFIILELYMLGYEIELINRQGAIGMIIVITVNIISVYLTYKLTKSLIKKLKIK